MCSIYSIYMVHKDELPSPTGPTDILQAVLSPLAGCFLALGLLSVGGKEGPSPLPSLLQQECQRSILAQWAQEAVTSQHPVDQKPKFSSDGCSWIHSFQNQKYLVARTEPIHLQKSKPRTQHQGQQSAGLSATSSCEQFQGHSRTYSPVWCLSDQF